jgi:ABC-type lipoprotein release transport system permease subunit
MESQFTLKTESYDESFAEIRNAYILTIGSTKKLQGLIQISSQSAILLLFVIVFIASASAYLITERRTSLDLFSDKRRFSISINLLIAVLLYAFLVASFYTLFAGCRLVPKEIFVGTSIVSFIMGQVIVTLSPKLLSEKTGERRSIQFGSAIVAAFSMACRNLRRRKIRTILNLANIAILIFGFITFTSISSGYGLVTQSLRPNLDIDALIIKDESIDSSRPFMPIPASFLSWLESQPNITAIAPKAENTPISAIGKPLDYLYSRTGDSIAVYGILGIMPSLEANLTLLNKTVIEGDYLKDDDTSGILIDSSLKNIIDVTTGDKLYGFGQEFNIRGFFDKRVLESLTDIDRKTIIPYWIEEGNLVPCNCNAVIILLFEKALTLPKVSISRVVIQLENLEEYSSLARIIALTREYKVYISHPGSLYLLSVQNYMEEKGAIIVPFLMLTVIMNIAVSMFGSMRERRNEISSLSYIGLNPTHIATLFVAEAIVIGFVGGGFGFLSGIFGYRVASNTLFGALQVQEKVSAEWGLIALLLSVCTAVIASLLPALQASTIITPSLLRKWNLRQSMKPKEKGQPWVIDLPVKLKPKELDPFIGFILKRMRESEGIIADARLEEEVLKSEPLKRLLFKFSLPDQVSENELLIKGTRNTHYDLTLRCIPYRESKESVLSAVSFLRKLIFEWNAKEFNVVTPFDPSLSQLYTLVNAYTPTSLYIVTIEPEISEKLEKLTKVLVERGLRPPRTFVSKIEALDVEQIMKTAKELVSKADIICISGEPAMLSSALAMNAAIQNKITCYVIDPRPKKQHI